MTLKKTLKLIKLHQEQISMFFGVLILIVAGIFVINYVKDLKKQSSAEESKTTQNSNQSHTVTKGETLWDISKIYYKDGASWEKIAAANNITNAKKLEVGQNLTIPSESPKAEVKASPSPKPQITETAASTSSEITNTNYKVVKGDNLWKIALRAYGDGYKWIKIATANNLHNPNLIYSGNVLIIPR